MGLRGGITLSYHCYDMDRCQRNKGEVMLAESTPSALLQGFQNPKCDVSASQCFLLCLRLYKTQNRTLCNFNKNICAVLIQQMLKHALGEYFQQIGLINVWCCIDPCAAAAPCHTVVIMEVLRGAVMWFADVCFICFQTTGCLANTWTLTKLLTAANHYDSVSFFIFFQKIRLYPMFLETK